jgi:hypothetical protein
VVLDAEREGLRAVLGCIFSRLQSGLYIVILLLKPDYVFGTEDVETH